MKTSIVILHGWGLFGNKYLDLRKILEKNGYKVYAPDLPGFGKEKRINNSMTLDDYVIFFKNFLDKLKLKKVILIGHSFGGRISVKFTAKYPEVIEKLILTGAPILRPSLNFRKRIISNFLKFFKIFIHFIPYPINKIARYLIYKIIGESDYYKAQGMKETFVNVINEDLTEIAKQIKNKTLLVWGKNDKLVPIYIGQGAREIIKNSKFIILPNEGHGLPYKNPEIFSKVVINFLKDK